MNPNQDDMKWIASKLREEFDTPREIYQVDKDLEIIERAERFGLLELAEQMRNDVIASAHIPNTIAA